EGIHALIVPGGFGQSGSEGKIQSIQFARENQIPFLGICLGMQLACVEAARHLCGIENAHSQEFDASKDGAVIHYLTGQSSEITKGGTMRLGSYPCSIEKASLAYRLYSKSEVNERHRHRLEFNNEYQSSLEEKGLCISGKFRDQNLAEIIELKSHPYFI